MDKLTIVIIAIISMWVIGMTYLISVYIFQKGQQDIERKICSQNKGNYIESGSDTVLGYCVKNECIFKITES